MKMMQQLQQPSFVVDGIPSDVTAAALQLLDARDLLLLAVGLRRPLTDLVPREWAFQVWRPLSKAEQMGLVGVGVPRVHLWSRCPFKPDEPTELVIDWSWFDISDYTTMLPNRRRWKHRITRVVEDARGALYRCRDYDNGALACWELISEDQLKFYTDTLGHPPYMRRRFEQEEQRRRTKLRAEEPPLLLQLLLTNE